MIGVKRTPRTLLAVGAAALAVALSSCAGNSVNGSSSSPSSSASASASGPTIVVGGADFTEMKIMQQMYVQLLQHAGFKTSTVTASNREIYFGQLAKGSISVVPEYAATLAEYLNDQKNGADATTTAPIATSDATATVAAAQPLAEADGVELLKPAKAADQNAFAVTKAFAKTNNLKTLSDLGQLGQPVTLAAVEECPQRPFCQPGLAKTYGITVSKLLPLGFDTPQVKQSVQSGESQLGLVATTDGTLSQFGLVALTDDKSLQLADNLVPAVNKSLAANKKLAKALDSLAPVLTTADLAQMNAQVDGQRMLPAAVAKSYLKDKNLI